MAGFSKALEHLRILQKHQIGGDPDSSEGVIDLLYRKNPAALDAVFSMHRVVHGGLYILLQELMLEEDGIALEQDNPNRSDSEEFTVYDGFFSRFFFSALLGRIRLGCQYLSLPFIKPVIGSLALGDANASTFYSPEGEPIIAINSGLFPFLFKLSHSLSFCFATSINSAGEINVMFSGRGDCSQLTREQKDGFIKLWSDYGAYGYTPDPVLNIVETRELATFPLIKCLFTHLMLFVVAHEYAHILIRHLTLRDELPYESAELSADTVALQICLAYITSISASPLEKMAPVYCSHLFMRLIDIRREVRKKPIDSVHPHVINRQSGLLSIVHRFYPKMFEVAVQICASFDGAIDSLWDECEEAIQRQIAAAPPLIQFHEETQRYIWSLAGSLGSVRPAQRVSVDEGAEYSLANDLDETRGVVRRLMELLSSSLQKGSLIGQAEYNKAFSEVADEMNLSLFEAMRRIQLLSSQSRAGHTTYDAMLAAYGLGDFEAAAAQASNVVNDLDRTTTGDADGSTKMRALIDSGHVYFANLEYRSAVDAFTAANNWCTQSGTPFDWLIINIPLCRSLHLSGQVQKSSKMFPLLIHRLINYYGEQHWRVAESRNNHALLLMDVGQFSEAEKEFTKVLEVFTEQFGPAHSKTATVENNLGLAMEGGCRRAEALQHFRAALEIELHVNGEESLDVARVRNNLAVTLMNMGEVIEAEALVRDALRVAERRLGAIHPVVAKRLNNLAHILAMSCRLQEAETCQRRALAIYLSCQWEEHPDYAASLSTLGGILTQSCSWESAREAFTTAIDLNTKVFGRRHYSVARDLNNLGYVLSQIGTVSDWKSAESYLGESIRIMISQNAFASLSAPLSSLEALRRQIGALDLAAEGLQWALHEQPSDGGCSLPHRLVALCELSDIHKVRENHALAGTVMETALDLALEAYYSSEIELVLVELLWSRFTRICLLLGMSNGESELRFREICEEVRRRLSGDRNDTE